MTGRHSHRLRAALAAADVVAAVVAAGAGYLLRFRLAADALPVAGRTDVLPSRYLAALPAAVLLLLLAAVAAGMYDARRAVRVPTWADAGRISALSVATLATVALLYWREFQYSRATLLAVATLFGPLCCVFRRAAQRALARSALARAEPAALLVGGGRPARALLRAVAAEPWPGVRFGAVLSVGDDAGASGLVHLASLDAACDAIARGELRDAYVAVPAEHAARIPEILARAGRAIDARLRGGN